MLAIAAFVLLAAGGMLEVAGLAFPAIDLVVGTCFGLAMFLGGAAVLRARVSGWGLLDFCLAALALGLHLCINLGALG